MNNKLTPAEKQRAYRERQNENVTESTPTTQKSKINLDAAIKATPDDAIPMRWETLLDDHINEFNGKYAVVFYCGKTSVLK